MKKIAMSLSTTSITSALKELRRIERDVSKKMDTMCKRLAEIGATRVSMEYARAWYVGPKDISVSVEYRSLYLVSWCSIGFLNLLTRE